MDQKILDSICSQIYQQFPSLKGNRPKLRAYSKNQHLLIFQGKGTATDGRTIPQIVRVVVTLEGKIAKISSSR